MKSRERRNLRWILVAALVAIAGAAAYTLLVQ